MRVVVQRVSHASCTIDGQVTGSIQQGFLILVGFAPDDTQTIVDKIIHKIINLRVFEDENGKMNLSMQTIGGAILSISQFTLYANCKKGNRPSFVKAAKPDLAIPLYDYFNQAMQAQGIHVETGVFGANMKIDLCNDGPVTIVLDSEEICK
ncbi:MAG: D-aminoacyl-tRNA deacylase [Absicoccus porci]|uniref:D-aminoacyl-tRNA deacylase n=1 Tax=Absicoccus porci TaxID=2486576 RepID=A0A3N0I2K8_9FIRM|nr:D-aminoacyl-tRNA deacylase [Absicoccus porci]MCI6087963.1 D-aminoacyl-tRNA deacylase [Absicoccus porci]MDD7329622.1 D-aminoacyl-tRNA deacylase [Absicoccus porci]MDY4739123.1 D-aminoacyl-tRNA deacylase [Absicoccus porci]RNM31245.1 D-tyrosyl-tRNA(Tyr) deacylase [Absicoccus porci]